MEWHLTTNICRRQNNLHSHGSQFQFPEALVTHPSGRVRPDQRDVMRRFARQGLPVRLHLLLRRLVLDAERIEGELPSQGRVLDAGCGFGVLAMLAAMRGGRTVTGLDLDPARVRVAREAGAGIPGLSFEVGDVTALRGEYDAIAVVDILHYFEPAEQRRVLETLRGVLAPNGVLVARQAVRESGVRHLWTRLHERVMLGLSITRARGHHMHFPSPGELRDMYHRAGLEVIRLQRYHRILPYADHIVVARRRP